MSLLNDIQKQELIEITEGKLRFDYPMSQYTTYGVGGPCEALFEASQEEALKKAVIYLKAQKIPYMVMGRGSNLLVKDSGVEGVVIVLKRAFSEVQEEGRTLLVGAGLFLKDLLVFCRDKGLSGLEWAAGIPGTVGGAVIMNAGAFGEAFGTRVMEIYGMDPQGETVCVKADLLKFRYRRLEMEKPLIITRVRLKLAKDNAKNINQKMSENLKKRKDAQPLEFPNAGSVFKNPPGHFAARLIESVGLKGMRAGGAMISDKHANFIVNTGGATAEDILHLMHSAKLAVKEKTGIDLEPEICVIGKQSRGDTW